MLHYCDLNRLAQLCLSFCSLYNRSSKLIQPLLETETIPIKQVQYKKKFLWEDIFCKFSSDRHYASFYFDNYHRVDKDVSLLLSPNNHYLHIF